MHTRTYNQLILILRELKRRNESVYYTQGRLLKIIEDIKFPGIVGTWMEKPNRNIYAGKQYGSIVSTLRDLKVIDFGKWKGNRWEYTVNLSKIDDAESTIYQWISDRAYKQELWRTGKWAKSENYSIFG